MGQFGGLQNIFFNKLITRKCSVRYQEVKILLYWKKKIRLLFLEHVDLRNIHFKF